MHSLIEKYCCAINLYNHLFQYKMTEISNNDLSEEVCQVVISLASILRALRTQRDEVWMGGRGREERPLYLYQWFWIINSDLTNCRLSSTESLNLAQGKLQYSVQCIQYIFMFAIKFPVYLSFSRVLQIQQGGRSREYIYLVQFLPMKCTACTTLGGRNSENGTFSKPVKEIVTFIYNKKHFIIGILT